MGGSPLAVPFKRAWNGISILFEGIIGIFYIPKACFDGLKNRSVTQGVTPNTPAAETKVKVEELLFPNTSFKIIDFLPLKEGDFPIGNAVYNLKITPNSTDDSVTNTSDLLEFNFEGNRYKFTKR